MVVHPKCRKQVLTWFLQILKMVCEVVFEMVLQMMIGPKVVFGIVPQKAAAT